MIDYTLNKIIERVFSNYLDSSSKRALEQDIKIHLVNSYERFRLTKNLLFRNEPIDFYSNYLPLTLKGDNNFIRIKNPIEIIDNFHKTVILGKAGSGKTTLLKYILLKSIDNSNIIPIYLELRNFVSEKNNFEKFVCDILSENYSNEIKKLFNSGKFLFLFDGFDEINYTQGRDTIEQIQKFITKYSKNKFIITSRPGTNVESLDQFRIYEIAPLNVNDVSLYIERLELSNHKKEIFYNSIRQDSNFEQYLSTPLFLSIYINYIVSQNELNIPKNKSIFFRNIIDTLFSKHDSISKLGYVRNKLSGLNKDELEYVSILLAFRALITSKHMFTKDNLITELELIKRNQKIEFENEKLIYDLTITVNILVLSTDYYSFPHILLLEYLASLFISRLPNNTKQSFYGKILKNNQIQLSPSLLNFLYELDKQAFLKGFLIPVMEDYNFSYSNGHLEMIVDEFIKFNFKTNNKSISRNSLLNEFYRMVKMEDDNELGELFSM
ncbi:NACHT domain-containing protein [Tenacibaculum aiptasiae]|uniref:NACHT domain-containing protein n=1 Tax=Tenacibaculum aiptasiae TaxID=426481 RepID=A0A7J5ALU9_9FLAO|nr:NACHT domain-containing protein [Tenacibaculum aiptasiae]KAB1158564.1 NACHT domain-containing protein [Tenacibaculum aiptasiae]